MNPIENFFLNRNVDFRSKCEVQCLFKASVLPVLPLLTSNIYLTSLPETIQTTSDLVCILPLSYLCLTFVLLYFNIF